MARPRVDGDAVSATGNVATETVRGVTYWYDTAAADRVCNFFEHVLTLTEGKWAGQPFVLMPWQRRITRDLFGWKRPDGTRRYRECFVFVPRKNAKTAWASGIALYMLGFDGEPPEAAAQVYNAASEREQARLTFTMSKLMVLADPALAQRLKPYRNTIVDEKTNSVLRVLSADADTKHGFNVHCAVIDELHAHKKRDLYDVLQTATGARAQPLLIVTTTAGDNTESIAWQTYQYAKEVEADPEIDPSYYPCIFEADIGEGDDWTDPEVWRKANPSLGITVPEEFIASQCAKAQRIPGYTNAFLRLHLNIWTTSTSRWLDVEVWDKQGIDRGTREEYEQSLRGRECYAGLDLSSTTDITALAGVFPRERRETDPVLDLGEYEVTEGGVVKVTVSPDSSERVFDVLARFWLPGDRAEVRATEDKVPYPEWIRQGWITPTRGNAIDQQAIRREVLRWHEMFELRQVAVDPFNGASLIMQLEEDGVPAFSHRQGFVSMTGPTKAFETNLMQGTVFHDTNPILRWMLRNVVAESDAAGNIKPSKKYSRERIDGVVALIMAIGRAELAEKPETSVYERRGLIDVFGDEADSELAQPE
jgi:phage terminase large subunit-like protein